ncbi:dual oxidase maturation factor 1 isoform X3 [Strongylocentrotus purpuratus]|uniref:Dual oxidase maturation factor 1 n=1 Tax=Strongylocentrotus purpuratus TaxID=7668 RepID=A0A7M7RH18_STRPU|nr:dual oxidase maturation factor 1 isoform X3 [Strongylocentrotus purpuratus]|eukprot:XP_801771.1 PREDICTED: dual oxidase maturation factor 1 isoform X3 [Strongylocentrotus purpuratus]
MGNTYTAFREQGLPTYYPPNKTAVTADVLEIGFIFAFVIAFFSFIVILPGIRGMQRCYSFVRITISLFIGAGIMLSLWGQEWEKAELHGIETYYKAFSYEEIHDADIEVKIGLNSVNITLKAPANSLVEHPDEVIDYNERFHFYGGQGRGGFGRFSGRINREFREAQWSGKPYPVLWIAEYFTLDGEDIRWGRSYRMAGYYAYIMVWLSFPLWILANILFFMVIRNGAYFLIMTGGSLLTANVLYATIRYGSELKIPFAAHHVLEFHKGPSFWLCMVAGLISVICGFIVLAMDYIYPLEIASFFNVDPLQDFEDTYLIEHGSGMDGSNFEEGKANGDSNGQDICQSPPPEPIKGKFEYRSRHQSRFAKSRRRPRPTQRGNGPADIDEGDEAEESSTPTSQRASEQQKRNTQEGIPLEVLGDSPKSPTTDM